MDNYFNDLLVLTNALNTQTAETKQATANLTEALALLHDFEVWYSLDDMTRIRGKNNLEHLRSFMEKLHKEKEQNNAR